MPLSVDRNTRLPKSEYFAEPEPKSGIALHHTVSGTAHAAIAWWRSDATSSGKPRRVATAYVIDRDGTIYELFDPTHWAFHLGVPWPDAERVAFEKRFIGIEIASEGALTEVEGRLYAYDIVDPVFMKPHAEALECPALYRGYKWFDRYEPRQLQALGALVDQLCRRFAIPRVYPEQPFVYYGERLKAFQGVIGHANVRLDKSDPAPDPALWQTLEAVAGLRPVAVPAPRVLLEEELTAAEIEALFNRNVRRIDRMHVPAGSLVKNLLMELERRDTYLELMTPEPGARAVRYELLRGDPAVLARIADWLGFERVTESELEVRDA
jgi:hypothetical protein